jgi:multiple sugar transport system substrate-binding protein
VPVIRETIKRSVPTLAIPGAFGLHNILDENISAAMTGSATVEEAMKKAAAEWRKFIKKKGEKRMLDALNAARSGWPSVIDKA